MFTFLNSSILAGLVAALIPLIILLITRQKVKRIYYSSVIFLRELRSQQIRNIKLRQILLFIIRTLIILLLIFAFARPTMKSSMTHGFESQSKSSIVIIVDNSMSMSREVNGISLLTKAKEKLDDMMEVVREGDEIFLIYANSKADYIYEGPRFNVAMVRKIINKIEPSQLGTDIYSAMVKVKQVLENSHNLNKEIYIVSDLQEVGFDKFDPVSRSLFEQTDIKIYIMPLTANELNNLSVSGVCIGNQIYERGKTIDISAAISNNGFYDMKDKIVQLLIDGKRVSQSSVDVSAGSVRDVSLKFTPETFGLITGEIILEDDDLLSDNRYYFSLNIPYQTKILLLTGESVATRYLPLALNILPGISYDISQETSVDRIDFDAYDAIILSDVATITPDLNDKIDDFLKNRKTVIIFPGARVNIKNYNETLVKRYNMPTLISAKGTLASDDSLFVTFSSLDYAHPILAMIFEKKPDQFDSPRITSYIKVQPNKQSRTIINLSDNSPFLCETDYNGGKLIYFSSTADEKWSDLPYKSIFVPLLHQCINYGIRNNYLQIQFHIIDDEINVSYKVKHEIDNVRIVTPDKNEIFINPEMQRSDYNIRFSEARSTGIYTLMKGSELFDKWAINFDTRELRFKTIQEDTLDAILGQGHVMVVNDASVIHDSVKSARLGVELWKYFLMFVLLLLLVEMLISRESKKEETDFK
ncbi:BatA domain-containing protein [candidate division KSB1 bacterium]|nr:BatA domain-containing protein [candidate division KSB1 bacterium]